VHELARDQRPQAERRRLVQSTSRPFAGPFVEMRRQVALLLHAAERDVDAAALEPATRGRHEIEAIRGPLGRQEIEHEGFERREHELSLTRRKIDVKGSVRTNANDCLYNGGMLKTLLPAATLLAVPLMIQASAQAADPLLDRARKLLAESPV